MVTRSLRIQRARSLPPHSHCLLWLYPFIKRSRFPSKIRRLLYAPGKTVPERHHQNHPLFAGLQPFAAGVHFALHQTCRTQAFALGAHALHLLCRRAEEGLARVPAHSPPLAAMCAPHASIAGHELLSRPGGPCSTPSTVPLPRPELMRKISED